MKTQARIELLDRASAIIDAESLALHTANIDHPNSERQRVRADYALVALQLNNLSDEMRREAGYLEYVPLLGRDTPESGGLGDVMLITVSVGPSFRRSLERVAQSLEERSPKSTAEQRLDEIFMAGVLYFMRQIEREQTKAAA